MNFVFPALAIFALILPGVLFRRAYKKGDMKYPLGRLGPVAEQVPDAVLWAMCLNTVGLAAVSIAHVFVPRLVPAVDYESALRWLSNNFGKDNEALDRSIKAIEGSVFHVLGYLVLLYGASWGLGFLAHRLVRKARWDHSSEVWRFDNHWHYLFLGEVLKFRDKKRQGGLPDQDRRAGAGEEHLGTMVAAVVDFKDRSVLYLGVFVDFFFNASGDLEGIVLEGVSRRDLADDEPDPETTTPPTPPVRPVEVVPTMLDPDSGRQSGGPHWYEVRGHFFILRMSEVRTLNLDYITKADIDAAERLAEEEEREFIRDGGIGG